MKLDQNYAVDAYNAGWEARIGFQRTPAEENEYTDDLGIRRCPYQTNDARRRPWLQGWSQACNDLVEGL